MGWALRREQKLQVDYIKLHIDKTGFCKNYRRSEGAAWLAKKYNSPTMTAILIWSPAKGELTHNWISLVFLRMTSSLGQQLEEMEPVGVVTVNGFALVTTQVTR